MQQLPCLVVDLDGTLTRTDTLVESVLGVLRQSPLNLLRLPLWLLQGRAGFKDAVAERMAQGAGVSAAHLPYCEPLLAYLQEQKKTGRRIVLATAAHASIAHDVAAHLGLFDAVLATTSGRNLKGAAKLAAIREQVGEAFVYAGDSRADLPVWAGARGAILVDATPAVAATVRATVPVEREFRKEAAGPATWLRALRLHQWLKNLLLLVPLLTAFSFMELQKLSSMVLAFLAFSLAASATYLCNDLWDLENDRAHPRKKLRPFAHADLPIGQGLAMAGVLLVLALALAWGVNKGFLVLLLLYLGLTTAYTWVFKEYVLIDVLTLSLLYSVRILAGAAAIGVPTSSWLLAFSVFVFLSLALVKRCSELVSLAEAGGTVAKGRDYRVADLAVLWPLGVGSAMAAVVVFGLFISAPETQARYASPVLLWLVAVGLIYWLGRLWIKTSRSEMHDDPLLFAVRDHGSRIVILAMLAVVLAARFLHLGVSL